MTAAELFISEDNTRHADGGPSRTFYGLAAAQDDAILYHYYRFESYESAVKALEVVQAKVGTGRDLKEVDAGRLNPRHWQRIEIPDVSGLRF